MTATTCRFCSRVLTTDEAARAVIEVVTYRTLAGVDLYQQPSGRAWCSTECCLEDTRTEREVRAKARSA